MVTLFWISLAVATVSFATIVFLTSPLGDKWYRTRLGNHIFGVSLITFFVGVFLAVLFAARSRVDDSRTVETVQDSLVKGTVYMYRTSSGWHPSHVPHSVGDEVVIIRYHDISGNRTQAK